MTTETLKKPDFMFEEDFAIYQQQRKEFLTGSYLKEFDKSPALCHGTITGKFARAETPALAFGTKFHSFVLEKDKFDKNYVKEPDKKEFPNKKGEVTDKFRATTKYKDWLKDLGEQRLIELDDLALLEMLDTSIKTHPIARKMLAHGWSEHVVRAELHGVMCQIRMDHYNPDWGIIDIKTCMDLDKFQYDISKFGYPTSASLYREVFQVASKEFFPPNYYLVAVEKSPPYRTGVFKCTEDVLEMHGKLNEKNIKEFKKCRESGVWPLGFEEIETYEYL